MGTGTLNLEHNRRGVLVAGLLLFSLLHGVGAVYSLGPATRPYSIASIATWLATIAAFLLLVVPSPEFRVPGSGPHPSLSQRERGLLSGGAGLQAGGAGLQAGARLETAALAAIVLLGLALRLIRLEEVPPLVHGDEGEMGATALSIVLGRPDAPWFFGTGFLEHPSLHFYLEALSIEAFGATFFALRFVTALWGALGVLATYLAGRELVNRRAGLLAAAIAASAPLDLHMSRVSLNNVETEVLCALAVWCLCRGARLITSMSSEQAKASFWSSSIPLSFGVSGVFVGLSLYFYFGSRTIPLILGLYSLHALARARCRWRTFVRAWAVGAAGALMVVAPLLAFYVRQPHLTGNGRFRAFFLLDHLGEARQFLHVSSDWQVLWVQLRESLAQFFTRPDGSTFFYFGGPILIAPVAALFACGLALSLLTLKRPGSVMLATWFWVALLNGNVLMTYAPYTPRLAALLSAVYILAGLSLDAFLGAAERLAAPVFRRWLVGLATLVIAAITATSIDDYFFVYFRKDVNPPPTAVARFVAGLPPGTYVYGLQDGIPLYYGPTKYLAWFSKGEELRDPLNQVPALQPRAGSLAFVVFPRWASLLPAIEQRFPGGQERMVLGYQGQLVFTTYVVDSAQ